MALEITGLTVGALALIGTFKDCVDVFGMIVSARSLTDDAEILNTKLDIEKMLLLQWADRLKLTEPTNYDSRLDDPDLNRVIARVLESIKRLLSDGKTLSDRYGIVNYYDIRQNIVLGDSPGITASSTRLQQFTERFNRLSLQTGMPRRDHSVSTRFKWVVRDKDKFANLMVELSYFVSRLNALVPAQEQPGVTMTEEDLAKIRSIPQLKLIVKVCIVSQPQIAIIAQKMIQLLNQRRVLDRLWFRWIDDRKTSITDRHFRTLDWALDPLETTLEWDNLGGWLRDWSGLYWLAGKAGSGKSTLMKYLSDHPQTINLLRQWAGNAELITLQFFFYALGRSEQKSQEGILRSFLYQFLDKHRDLIEDVLPAMWREAICTEDQDYDLAVPSISEMQASLLQLAGTVSVDMKFWILIDGLDEFEGKHTTIAAFLSKLERLPNVKVMVSSRPLPVFVSAFDHAPKMYLQDLTHQDMQNYINDTILHHPRTAQLLDFGSRATIEIAQLLRDKASGVFLWVVLACQSILEGLDEHDTVPELLKRVMELPPELNDFFRQIIGGMDPRKRDQGARFLRLVFESQTSTQFDPIPTVGLAIIDEQGLRADFMGHNAAMRTNDEMVKRCQRLEGRLRSRCSGLVETQVDSGLSLAGELGPLNSEGLPLINSRVVFMHRSLYEFLCTEGMWDWDVLCVDNECGMFEPHLILASLWAQLGCHAFHVLDQNRFEAACYKNALAHNRRAAATNCPVNLLAANFSRLQGLFTAGKRWSSVSMDAERWLPHRMECRKGYEDLSAGLAIAAEFEMISVVRLALENPDELRRTLIPVSPRAHLALDCCRLAACPTRLFELNRDHTDFAHRSRSTVFPLLYHAACRPFLSRLRQISSSITDACKDITVSTDVVRYLLEKGHDPNERFFTDDVFSTDGEFPRDESEVITTPWVVWLKYVGQHGPYTKAYLPHESPDVVSIGSGSDLNGDLDVELVHQRAAITLLFVKAGAELGAPGTGMDCLLQRSLSRFILEAAGRRGETSVEWTRSDALWLQVRDTILSLRSVGSH